MMSTDVEAPETSPMQAARRRLLASPDTLLDSKRQITHERLSPSPGGPADVRLYFGMIARLCVRPAFSVTMAATVAALAIAATSTAFAESRTSEKRARTESGKDVRIGVYINVRPDCTSGPLPSIRLAAPPANGRVTVRKANVTATNYKQCLALQVPAFVAIYRSRKEFSGIDTLELEVKYPSGRLEIQKFQITVGSPPAAQPI
jgi:hypothetical protein